MSKILFADGFVSLGMGSSDLDMSNDVLELDATHKTRSQTVGGSIAGVYDMMTYEFWPVVAFTVGRSNIGKVDFTGRAYGLSDTTLSLDTGSVTVANFTFRPEVRVPFACGDIGGAATQVTFAPSHL